MIARIRGEHNAHWGRWRPSASRENAAPGRPRVAAAAKDELAARDADGRPRGTRSRQRRVGRWIVGLAVAMIAGYLAVNWSVSELSPGLALPRLPATPRAWLDAYEAAAVDNPGRVCSELFAPALAAAYARAVHGSCADYFRRMTSFSVVVRRVLSAGDTAVLELRQTVRPRDWAVVLDRRRNGWQAVDLLTGNLAR